MLLLLAGCATSTTQLQQVSSPPFSALHRGEVFVPSPDVQLTGFLYQPATPGPHPAMLHLHGCSGFRNAAGMPNESYRFWADHWVQRGFVVLILDSLAPRGEKEICTQNALRIRAHVERVRDAYAGLAYLQGLPGVDGDRVFLQGWSNGGTTTLNAINADAPRPRSGRPGFRAAIAYYPGCLQLAREFWNPTTPVLIQAGAADNWTPAVYCQQIAERARGAGVDVSIDTYPDAHHAFDRLRLPFAFRPNVGAGNKGAHVGTNGPARDSALKRTTDWVLGFSR
ncbi:MAG: dienelactone hydrolase family protein [Betaproteobacteria bacterium]